MNKILLYALFFLSFQLAKAQEQFSVYFDSNKYDLTAKEKDKLNQWILANSTSKIVGIHGFCDEDGTNSYNDTLAKNRINFVYNYIKDKLKIREDFKTRNFGELHTLSKIKSENRKVTLFYIESKYLNLEN